MNEVDRLTDREFFEGIINTVREQTYTYILDMLGNCDNCEHFKTELKKELVKIHKKNIETTRKHINGSS